MHVQSDREHAIHNIRNSSKCQESAEQSKVDLPRFGGRVVESIYSAVLMLLLCLSLGFSVPGVFFTGKQ
jgi:hypothetical protein